MKIPSLHKYIFILVLILASTSISAYEVNTHQAITQKTVTPENRVLNLKHFLNVFSLGNKNYSSFYIKRAIKDFKKLAELNPKDTKVTDLIEAGSISEDRDDGLKYVTGRYFNHFYDPVFYDEETGYGRGLDINILSLNFNLIPRQPISRDWAYDGGRKTNERSIVSAFDYYDKSVTSTTQKERKENQELLFVSMGHLIHLIQDVTQPAHTRNDSHTNVFIFPDGSSQLELYGKEHITPTKIKEALISSNMEDVESTQLSSFAQYFDEVATFTNLNFFSDDTIFKDYDNPSLLNTDTERSDVFCASKGHVIGTKYVTSNKLNNSVTDDPVCLAKVNKQPEKEKYTIKDTGVLIDNAAVLLPKAVSYGEGIIDYFFRGRIEISGTQIKNISDTSTVVSEEVITFKPGLFRLYYETNCDQGNNNCEVKPLGQFDLLDDLAPGESVPIPTFILDEIDTLSDIGEDKIFRVIYRGAIGTEEGIAVTRGTVVNSGCLSTGSDQYIEYEFTGHVTDIDGSETPESISINTSFKGRFIFDNTTKAQINPSQSVVYTNIGGLSGINLDIGKYAFESIGGLFTLLANNQPFDELFFLAGTYGSGYPTFPIIDSKTGNTIKGIEDIELYFFDYTSQFLQSSSQPLLINLEDLDGAEIYIYSSSETNNFIIFGSIDTINRCPAPVITSVDVSIRRLAILNWEYNHQTNNEIFNSYQILITQTPEDESSWQKTQIVNDLSLKKISLLGLEPEITYYVKLYAFNSSSELSRSIDSEPVGFTMSILDDSLDESLADCIVESAVGFPVIRADDPEIYDEILAEALQAEYYDLLYCPETGANVSSLRGIRLLKYLIVLAFDENNNNLDLSPLATNFSLEEIHFPFSSKVDKNLSALANLTNLREIHLSNIGINDLTPLLNLKNLEILDFLNNEIEDLTPLANLTKLKLLFLGNNKIKDLNPLINSNFFDILDLSNNLIEDLTPLSEITIDNLDVRSNCIDDFTPIAHIPSALIDGQGGTQCSSLLNE